MRYYRYKRKRAVSLFAIFSFIIFAVVYALLFFSKRSSVLADRLNDTVCHYFRLVMAKLGGLLPFSLYEVLMLSIPLIVVIIIIIAVRRFRSGEGRLRFIINLFAIVLLFIAGHNLSLGIGYNTTSIDKKMDMKTVKVTEARLAEIMISLRDEINILSEQITYTDGVSSPDLSFEEISAKLCDSYDSFYSEYSFPKTFDSTAKSVYFGNLMSYMGITGIYTYYTGDANVNSAYPMYDMTFTAAHELAHQRGISRENEANFMAYLVTSTSDDPYIRYSGALSMYEYIGNALYKTNKSLYREINSGLTPLAKGDMSASYAVSQKYGDTFIDDISTFVNDLFLKSNGTAGVVTYGRVVTLTVAYYESMK